MKHTYSHRFTGDIVCTFTIDTERLTAGRADMVDCLWSRKIEVHERVAIFHEYLQWKEAIMQDMANRSGKTMLEVVEVKRGVWLPRYYEPNN
jgi:hypothetical protein